MNSIRELIYQVNKKNSEDISEDFNFNEREEKYIRDSFWPIIILNDLDIESIKGKIIEVKKEFVDIYKEFDIELFKRKFCDLGYLEWEIKEFLETIKKDKFHIWAIKKEKYFYHLKLDGEIDIPNAQTLLITEKDEIQLEFYFRDILKTIIAVTEENEEKKELLAKFNHIGFVDHEKIKQKLKEQKSISNMLYFLKHIKENYFDKYLAVLNTLNEEEKIIAINRKEVLESIYGNFELETSLQIQIPIYDEFFSHLENKNLEYQFWFIKFDAEKILEEYKISQPYKSMLASPLREKRIKSELKKITDKEEKAYQILEEKGNDVDKEYRKGSGYSIDLYKSSTGDIKYDFTQEETQFIEVLKILERYYENNIEMQDSLGNLRAENYFLHILNKQHLKDLLQAEITNEKKEPNYMDKAKFKKEKHEIVLPKLSEYKFEELEKNYLLDTKSLAKHIFSKKLPYQVAYLDYLGFIENINKNYSKSKTEANKLLSKILDTTERQIRGNVNVLNPNSKEDKTKYTSHLHKDNVEKHYLSLK